jgi:heptosyltransferase-2
MQKILIIQTASLGDVILATATAETLHANFPEAQIDILVKKDYISLFEKHPYLTNVISFDRKAKKWKEIFKILFKIRREKYSIVINIQRFFTSGFLTIF